jgi:N-hydroxyarylamine O-acetyltransferase
MSMPPLAQPAVSEAVLEAAIVRLDLAWPVPHTLEGLQGVYRAWCRGIGCDSVGLALRSVPSSLDDTVGFPAENYFRRWLAFGVGDLCFANAEALVTLLRHLKYRAVRVIGSMGPNARHGSVVVTLDGESYLVDPTFLAEQPLLLRNGERTTAGEGPLRIWANGDGTVKWPLPQGRIEVVFKIEEVGCDFRTFQEHEEEVLPGAVHPRSRMSRLARMYKDRLFIRRNVDGGTRTYDNGKVVVKTGRHLQVRKVHREEFARLLTSEFGIAAEIVRRIPVSYLPGEPLGTVAGESISGFGGADHE